MKQAPLFNYQCLTSSKMMKAYKKSLSAKPAVTPGFISSNSMPTTESPVPAQNAAKTTSPSSKPSKSSPEIDTFEFHLPDEDRALVRLRMRCENCKAFPTLERRHGHYRVRCVQPSHFCKPATAWQKSSADAIRIWKMMRLLTK